MHIDVLECIDMMSGICFKRFQKGRKEGEKEDGKEEKGIG